MISIIWFLLISIGIVFSLLTNNTDKINATILESTKTSLEMLFKIFPVMALWMGFTQIAQDSNLLHKTSKKLSPLLRKIFPEIPEGHESLIFIASNIVSNLFGLGSAATPFGLKAMESLQSINKNKKVASKSMITFLVINTSGLTLIPTTIISLRMLHNSKNPSIILFACILSTLFSTIGGLVLNYIISRRNKY